MKNKEEKLEQIRLIKSEKEIHILLDELLPEMGYGNVKVTHEKGNAPEFGKDLVCSREDEIEGKLDWTAFVVKKGTIAGNASAITEIQDQIKECFEYPYDSIELRQKLRINKVKVVTNKHFSSAAKIKINSSNYFDQANVDFWNDEKLELERIGQYFKFWHTKSKLFYLLNKSGRARNM